MPTQIGNIAIPAKPPRYWVAAKRRLGMNERAFGRVWYHIYTDEKRLLTWMVAPESEWREHGLYRPTM